MQKIKKKKNFIKRPKQTGQYYRAQPGQMVGGQGRAAVARQQRPVGVVADARDGVGPAPRHHAHRRHFILGQRACLVRVDGISKNTTRTHHRHINNTLKKHQRHIKDISKTHQRHIKDTSKTHQKYIIRHVKDTSKTRQRHI